MDTKELMTWGIICAINAEIEGAKLDNQLRLLDGIHDRLNYPPEWFEQKAKEIQDTVNQLFK
jgi:hypothetical protein